jgi:cardiolipin synthase
MRACAFSFMRKDTCTPRRSVSTRRYAPIGSANIDIRSFTINYELNTVIYDERIAQDCSRISRVILRTAPEFDQSGCDKRKIPVRFRDSMARLVSPLL